MKIIDDFVPAKYQDELEKLFLDTNFNWFFNRLTVNYEYPGLTQIKNTQEGPHFTHVFCSSNEVLSNYYGAIQPLLFNLVLREGLCIDDVYRVKANLMLKDSNANKNHYRTPHIDYSGDTPCTTMIYYINSSDGDTFFFNTNNEITDRVSPKKGRLVIFDSNVVHAGQPPRVTDVRVLININIFNTGYTK